jgi:hypothetical protein
VTTANRAKAEIFANTTACDAPVNYVEEKACAFMADKEVTVGTVVVPRFVITCVFAASALNASVAVFASTCASVVNVNIALALDYACIISKKATVFRVTEAAFVSIRKLSTTVCSVASEMWMIHIFLQ